MVKMVGCASDKAEYGVKQVASGIEGSYAAASS